MSNDIPYSLPFYLVKSPITLNTSFVLGWVPIYYIGYFVQAVWTGTPTGVFYLNASGDAFSNGTGVSQPKGAPFYHPPGLVSPVNTSLISGSSYTVSAAGTNAWNVNGSRYTFVQLGYTDNSSGTSTAQLTFANVTQKGPS